MTQSNRSRSLRQTRRTSRRATWPSAFASLWSAIRRRAGGRQGAAVLLLICASFLTGARLGDAAGTGVSQPRATLRVSPPSGLPPEARWIDVHNGTSYTIELQANNSAILARAGNGFSFTTPAGDQLVAALPISKLPDGTYTQTTPVNSTTGTITCSEGVLHLSKNSGGAQLIVYTLETHFDQYAMVAYAHLAYASARDKAGSASVCSGQAGQGNVQAFDMLSGCTASSCTSPVDSAGPTATAFESSVVSAARQKNAKSWNQIYNGSSRAITAQYGSDRFGALIEQQAKKKGRIKSITPSQASPQVLFDAAGQAYFTVTESVKLDKGGGNTSVVTITSYYLLESGKWVFWFSMPVGS